MARKSSVCKIRSDNGLVFSFMGGNSAYKLYFRGPKTKNSMIINETFSKNGVKEKGGRGKIL